MKQTRKVLWTKGLLLNPQHLQAQDRYLEDKLEFHLSALTPFPWGFIDLALDPESLEGGEVRLTRASGIFPDGLVFHVPDADREPPPRRIEGHWRRDQEALTVYLAIPDLQGGGRNVSESPGDTSTRYSPEVFVLRDENTGLAETEVLVARKNLRLLLEGEAEQGSSVLPVARILRTESGQGTYDEDFVPPLLDISASGRLLSIVRRLVEVMSARSAEIAGMRRQQNRSLAEFGRSDTAHFWLLYTLNSHLPLFRHLIEERPAGLGGRGGVRARRGHPMELYHAMAELAATLMTFEPSRHPRDLPAYDHVRLGECFGRMDDALRMLLETAIPSNCLTLPLKAVGNSIHATSLEGERHASAIQAYLAVTSEMDQSRLVERAGDWIKIGSRDHLQEMLSRFVSGLGFSHEPTPPSAVPVRMGCQYFRLEMTGRRWSEILESRTLAAWVSSELAQPELELVLLLPEE